MGPVSTVAARYMPVQHQTGDTYAACQAETVPDGIDSVQLVDFYSRATKAGAFSFTL